VWHYLRDPTFSRFDTIPECDTHTHTHTHTTTASRGKQVNNRCNEDWSDLHYLLFTFYTHKVCVCVRARRWVWMIDWWRREEFQHCVCVRQRENVVQHHRPFTSDDHWTIITVVHKWLAIDRMSSVESARNLSSHIDVHTHAAAGTLQTLAVTLTFWSQGQCMTRSCHSVPVVCVCSKFAR